jgi:ligand-binding sensor domain-containing protein
LLLFTPALAFTQSFSYVHYDTRDGLAGSTVYDMCQDKEGFIWFATENGLSRFDGTNFKNFSVKDGLPDNEVLRVFADSKGRVWLGTFSKEPSFFYKNNIHNSSNDSIFKKIKFISNILFIDEDKEGNIMIGDNRRIFKISVDNEVTEMTALPAFKKIKTFYWNIYPDYFDGGFCFNADQAVYKLAGDSLALFYKKGDTTYPNLLQSDLSRFGKQSVIILPNSILSSTKLKNSYKVLIANTTNGSWSIDTLHNKLDEHFLPGKTISASLIDREENTWFASFGEGIFKMPSREIQVINQEKDFADIEKEVYTVVSNGSEIIAGMGDSKAMIVQNKVLKRVLDFTGYLKFAINSRSNNRLFSMERLSSGALIFGFDNFLVKSEAGKYTFNYLQPVKSIAEFDIGHLLVATRDYSYKLRISDLAIVDTIWRERCTDIFCYEKKIYIGTLQGLYEIETGNKPRYLGNLDHALQRRINDIKATADGTILIATNDEGLVAYKEGKLLYILNDANGLSSNICKTLFIKGPDLWVGTNKGINKINLANPSHPVTRFSMSDGLPSDIIHSLYIDDSTIWAATPAGLVFFNEKKITERSICNLELLSVTVSDKLQPIRDSYSLSYQDNNIDFDFAGISFKSGREIKYYYILKGLDKSWNQTSDRSIHYQSLPSGNYEFQIYARNKYGVQSRTISIHFSIATAFWNTWWFYVMIIISVIALTVFLVNQRNKRNKARIAEKRMFQNQFAILEQQALQAQMNPHFIFNCLSSIQQYILTNDRHKANQYLTDFASLIRQTLDNSGKTTIVLSDEVKYLERYLQMEKMRFGDSFSYEIAIHDDVQIHTTQIPAMLLQPFVENALRHGIRYKQEGFGKVKLSFSMDHGTLICSVKDNGVGRQKAAEQKSHQPIEYQSKGVELTSKRITLLNKINEHSISVEIIDLHDDQGLASGTEVIIKIPV